VPDFAGAQAEYLQAMDIARRQSARLWELRAAVSLARLWRDQDRNSDTICSAPSMLGSRKGLIAPT